MTWTKKQCGYKNQLTAETRDYEVKSFILTIAMNIQTELWNTKPQLQNMIQLYTK